MNLNNNITLSDINEKINSKIKNAFVGETTKDLKNNIKELKIDINNEYKQFGGLINRYIINVFIQIIKIITKNNKLSDYFENDILQNQVKTIIDSDPQTYEYEDNKHEDLIVFFKNIISEIKYDKETDRTSLEWFLDDLDELIEENYNEFKYYSIILLNYLNKNIEKIRNYFNDHQDQIHNLDNINTLMDKLKYINHYNNSDLDQKKTLIHKKNYYNLIKPKKKFFNLIASKRFNNFYKYTINSDITNEKSDTGEKFNDIQTDNDTILENKVFNDEENNNFINTVKNIIEFVTNKIENTNDRKDKEQIIAILKKIESVDIKMNTIFSDNVKMVKKLYAKDKYETKEKNYENRIERNKFITNIVKLQNNLFQFQIRIIFTQITHINNIINRRVLIDKSDKTEFMTKINSLLDIVNKKVEVMNEYLNATTDDNKNIIPLEELNIYNQYEYYKDPSTGTNKIIKKINPSKLDKDGNIKDSLDNPEIYQFNADELSNPTKNVLIDIKNRIENNENFEYKFSDRDYSKIAYEDELDKNIDTIIQNDDDKLQTITDPSKVIESINDGNNNTQVLESNTILPINLLPPSASTTSLLTGGNILINGGGIDDDLEQLNKVKIEIEIFNTFKTKYDLFVNTSFTQKTKKNINDLILELNELKKNINDKLKKDIKVLIDSISINDDAKLQIIINNNQLIDVIKNSIIIKSITNQADKTNAITKFKIDNFNEYNSLLKDNIKLLNDKLINIQTADTTASTIADTAATSTTAATTSSADATATTASSADASSTVIADASSTVIADTSSTVIADATSTAVIADTTSTAVIADATSTASSSAGITPTISEPSDDDNSLDINIDKMPNISKYLNMIKKSNVLMIFDNIDKNKTNYIITNYYIIEKLCLYIFNNNIIKKLMLLFLTPDILFKLLHEK